MFLILNVVGTKELRKRNNWQTVSGKKADLAEGNFYQVFDKYFKNKKYVITQKPKDFKNIYNKVKLDDKTLSEIYNPTEDWQHGIVPDYSIKNTDNGKILYVEVKRQDGWVENKPRYAGRGNAHERSCKYFTPGLLRILREKSGIKKNKLHFLVIFQGDITRDPKRVREITTWYDEYPDNFFLWYDNTSKSLIDYFKKISYLLE